MANPINLFSGKAADIARILLVNYPKKWAMREISRESGTALGWTSDICKALVRERLALRESKRGALKLMEPGALLRRWANYRNYAANTKFLDYYTEDEDVSRLFGKFKNKKGPEYAFCGLAGALLSAPFVRPTNAHIYVKSEEDAKKWSDLLKLRPAEEHGNVRFAIAESSGIFYGARTIKGVRVVSDIQLYVDLLNYAGRGEEAAEPILKAIERNWKGKG